MLSIFSQKNLIATIPPIQKLNIRLALPSVII